MVCARSNAFGAGASSSTKFFSKKKIALSGVAQLFKETRVGKNLNQYRQRLIRNFRFEYSKKTRSIQMQSSACVSAVFRGQCLIEYFQQLNGLFGHHDAIA